MIRRALIRISKEIANNNQTSKDLVIVGIKTRGEFLARRICNNLTMLGKTKVNWCSLSVEFYRDDINNSNLVADELLIKVVNKTIILVDDVLFTGRTVRAGMEGIIAGGRPRCIQLAVLVDRGHREMPIMADYVGKHIPTTRKERVLVKLHEYDKEEGVYLK